MMITGMIMTTMMAHISHHNTPFSPAFLAATMIGMVWTLAVARKTANRYSFQFRMSGEQCGGGEARPGQRQHDVPEDREARGAVELRRLFKFNRQIGEEIMHQPDDDRQIGDGIDQ